MKSLGSVSLINPGGLFSGEWRKPLNLSIGLHVLILVLAISGPSLFHRQRTLPEIYTVNLYSAAEFAETKPAPAASAPATKSPEKPAARQIVEPEPKKPAVSIQPPKPEPVPAVETVPAKPVSLEPVKEKMKVGKTKEEEAQEKAKLSQVVQRLKAGEAEKKARAEADAAAKDAVSKLADALKTPTTAPPGPIPQASTGQTSATARSEGPSGPQGTGIEPDFYMKQYYAAVYQQIHDHWVLPDLQNWDNSLEAVLIITIRKDGFVTDSFFERKSDNIYFNQFVLKAVKEASPLPPFPNQLQESTIEIGLRFKPGELY